LSSGPSGRYFSKINPVICYCEHCKDFWINTKNRRGGRFCSEKCQQSNAALLERQRKQAIKDGIVRTGRVNVKTNTLSSGPQIKYYSKDKEVICYCVQCNAVWANTTNRKSRFCSEECREDNYRLVERQLAHREHAQKGRPMRPSARIDTMDNWGDLSIRKRDREVAKAKAKAVANAERDARAKLFWQKLALTPTTNYSAVIKKQKDALEERSLKRAATGNRYGYISK
jgi:hypothetical protein